MGFLSGVFLAVALSTAPAEQQQNQSQTKETPERVAAPVFNPSICAKKRVDPCGCHHVYGIRHCHPNRKGDHCEAPVKAQLPAAGSTEAQKQPAPAPAAPEQKKQVDPKKSVSM